MAQEIIRFDQGYRFDDGHHFDEPPAFFLAPGTSQKGGRMPDFVPKDRDGKRAWLENLKIQIDEADNDFGLTTAQKDAVKGQINAQIGKMNATDAADAAAKHAREDEHDGDGETNSFLRTQINVWKQMAGLTDGIAAAMRIVGTAGGHGGEPLKVKFKIIVEPGGVRIEWTKGKLDGVRVYARLRGTAGWTFIGFDTSSPYTDNRPLANANVPEVREYMLRGVIKDVEVGLESDIQSATFAG